MKQTRKNSLFFLSLFATTVLIFIPNNSETSVPFIDKVAHLVLFCVISINGCYKFVDSNLRSKFLVWVIFYGLLTEVIQQFIPGRDMDLYDGLADTFGVIAGLYLYSYFDQHIDPVVEKIGKLLRF